MMIFDELRDNLSEDQKEQLAEIYQELMHDIRTPLTTIQMKQMLIKKSLEINKGTERIPAHLDKIGEIVQQIITMLEALDPRFYDLDD